MRFDFGAILKIFGYFSMPMIKKGQLWMVFVLDYKP